MTNEHEDKSIPAFDTKEDQAQFLCKSGFIVMPAIPGTTEPVGERSQWLRNHSAERIAQHWGAHPHDEVCIYAGLELYALRAHRKEALQQLLQLEEKHRIQPRVVVKHGESYDYYFALPVGVFAKRDLQDIEEHPERLEVVTWNCLLKGPGGAGHEILKWDIRHCNELTAVSERFVDDVARLNGRQPPSELLKEGQGFITMRTERHEDLDLAALRAVYGDSYEAASMLSDWEEMPEAAQRARSTYGRHHQVSGMSSPARRIAQKFDAWTHEGQVPAYA